MNMCALEFEPEGARRTTSQVAELSQAASFNSVFESLEKCMLCPRACGARRAQGERGVCGADDKLVVARAALHAWEEPPISGNAGSGTIFFSHCSLKCIYCQNAQIAQGQAGKEISIERLVQICLELQDKGALNINFVSPTHYAPYVRASVVRARKAGLVLPIVWNTSGYETVQTIANNKDMIDIYLSDFKYGNAQVAKRYSNASDYKDVACQALDTMLEFVGEPAFDEVDGQLRMTRGVIVRHLLLPGQLENSKEVLKLIHERYGARVRLSIMNQYTPLLKTFAQREDGIWAREALYRFPELAEYASDSDYESLLDYADELGIENYFWQKGPACEESFIPAFDLTGV